jgi:hypothetical protein
MQPNCKLHPRQAAPVLQRSNDRVPKFVLVARRSIPDAQVVSLKLGVRLLRTEGPTFICTIDKQLLIHHSVM